MKRVMTFAVLMMILALAAGIRARQAPESSAALSADALKGLALRSIGPALATGRIQDVEIDPKNPNVWYVATAFGGLWKTVNRGITFTPIFDDGGSFTLCCVVVDPKNSNVVWLGTGENTSQRSAHFGDGVYKSTDAGKTWKRVGLDRVRAHRQDPDRSAQLERRVCRRAGSALSAGGERGLYKTTDGGADVDRRVSPSATTPASTTRVRSEEPRHHLRVGVSAAPAVGQMIGGGPEGGIFKTTNAGKTWTKLTKGLPTGDIGRIALGVDAARRPPTRVSRSINAQACGGAASIGPGRCAGDELVAAIGRRGALAIGQAQRQVEAAAAGGGARRRAGDAGAARGGPRRLVSRRRSAGTTTRSSSIRIGPTRSGRSTRISSAARDGGKTWQRSRLRESTGMHVDHHDVAFDPDRSRITSSSATTAACTRPTTTARRGASSRTCRSRSTTACRWTTRSRSTTCAAARRTTGRSAVRRAR